MQTSLTQLAHGWDSAAVGDFVNSDRDILVLERPKLSDFAQLVASGRVHEFLAPICRDKLGFEVRSGLGELRIKSPELSSDLISLATAFLDQFDVETAKLRLEISRTQSCPKFHSDNVNVRLVSTYFGPTTEYQVAGEKDVKHAPLFGLVFLKGHRHKTHRDSVHHRSPEVPLGQKRLCIAIDY